MHATDGFLHVFLAHVPKVKGLSLAPDEFPPAHLPTVKTNPITPLWDRITQSRAQQ